MFLVLLIILLIIFLLLRRRKVNEKFEHVTIYLVETDIHDEEIGPICLCKMKDNEFFPYLNVPCSQQLIDFYRKYESVKKSGPYILKCYKRI